MPPSSPLPVPATEDRAPFALLAIVIGLAAVFTISIGLTYPLLAFILERQGVSATLIGLNTAMSPLGWILSAPLLPLAAGWIGAARFALAGAIGVAALLALIGAVQDLWLWFPARFLLGIAGNALFVTSETWINLLAPPGRRGRVLGVYTSVMALGFAAGPFVLALTGSEGWPPFLVGIGATLLATVLLVPMLDRLPRMDGGSGDGSLAAFLAQAPLLLVVVGAAAAFDQAVLALLPVYGLGFGIAEPVMASAVGVLIAGNIVLQLPIGWLADAWSRRGTMALLCVLTVAGAALLPVAVASPVLIWPHFFVWGSVAYGVYTIALVELGDRFQGAMLLAGNAAFAVMWGIGGMVGPALGGGAMDLLGPPGLPLLLAILYGALLVVLATRRV